MIHTDTLCDRAQWAFSLADATPHISDADNIAAWAVATQGYGNRDEIERQCLDYLIQARQKNAPSFSLSYNIALDLLQSLSLTANSASVRSSAEEEKIRLTKRGRHSSLKSPIYLWEEPKDHFVSGLLPNMRYRILKAGILTETQFK